MHEQSLPKLPAESYIDAVVNPAIDHWSRLRCGSYTAEWVAKAIGIQQPSANRLLRGPVWFDVFRPVFPGDMRRLFKSHGMSSIEVLLGELSDEERLNWIKSEVAIEKRSPVLLIRTKTLHWIAIGGYDDLKRVFYIYDSMAGENSLRPDLPIGNAQLGYDELLKMWRGRWFFKYVAITVTNVQVRDLKKEKIEAILAAYARGELIQKLPGIDTEPTSAKES